MIKFDYHMHTDFSIDAHSTMEDMILSAINKGLEEIAFTDHTDFKSPGRAPEYFIDYNSYRKKWNDLKDKYDGKINILLGAEVGMGRLLGKDTEDFIALNKFEFVIGSIHDIDEAELYNGAFSIGKSKAKAHFDYFAEIYESLKVTPSVDVVGHLDYVSRYGQYKDKSIDYNANKEIISEILKLAIRLGKGLEVNTSGYRYGLGDVYPTLDVLKMYKEYGGKVLTIGSDAHFADDIVKDFDSALKIIQSAGFTKLCRFKDKEPYWVNI